MGRPFLLPQEAMDKFKTQLADEEVVLDDDKPKKKDKKDKKKKRAAEEAPAAAAAAGGQHRWSSGAGSTPLAVLFMHTAG